MTSLAPSATAWRPVDGGLLAGLGDPRSGLGVGWLIADLGHALLAVVATGGPRVRAAVQAAPTADLVDDDTSTVAHDAGVFNASSDELDGRPPVMTVTGGTVRLIRMNHDGDALALATESAGDLDVHVRRAGAGILAVSPVATAHAILGMAESVLG